VDKKIVEKIMTKIIYADESYLIRGACFEVYKQMGCGFLEAVYQECLTKEFVMQKIPFEAQATLRLFYKGIELTKTYTPDFICFNEIIVELKAVTNISGEHRAQILNYLKATGFKLGLLVNFGSHPKAVVERFVL
jgi:GxxExxY protein